MLLIPSGTTWIPIKGEFIGENEAQRLSIQVSTFSETEMYLCWLTRDSIKAPP